MSVLLAGKRGRAPSFAALNGGLAVAAAVFAVLSGRAAWRLDGKQANPESETSAAVLGEVRGALEQIARAAQAGTIADTDAARHAFAVIARRVGECQALLSDRSP